MNKKKLFAIALAAAIAMVSAVTVVADGEILPYIESKCLGISLFVPRSTKQVVLKMTPPQPFRLTKIKTLQSATLLKSA